MLELADRIDDAYENCSRDERDIGAGKQKLRYNDLYQQSDHHDDLRRDQGNTVVTRQLPEVQQGEHHADEKQDHRAGIAREHTRTEAVVSAVSLHVLDRQERHRDQI